MAQPAGSNLSDLERAFMECIPCKHDSKQLRMLPCSHWFCENCIEYVATIHDLVCCPVCSKVMKMGLKQVQDLTSIDFINNLRFFLMLKSKFNVSVCGDCLEGRKAAGFCWQCLKFICQCCMSCHEMFEWYKGHSITSAEEVEGTNTDVLISEGMEGKRCLVHGEYKELYCIHCYTTICCKCEHHNHGNHDVHVSEVAADDQLERQLACLHPPSLLDYLNFTLLPHNQDQQCLVPSPDYRGDVISLDLQFKCSVQDPRLHTTGECRFFILQSDGSLYWNSVVHCRLHFVREGQKVPCQVFDIGGREYVVRYVPVERGHYQLSVIVSHEDAPTIKFTHKFWSRLLTE